MTLFEKINVKDKILTNTGKGIKSFFKEKNIAPEGCTGCGTMINSVMGVDNTFLFILVYNYDNHLTR